MQNESSKRDHAVEKLNDSCKVQGQHEHQHGETCGCKQVKHGSHIDYVHDGHLHRIHGNHVDECDGKDQS